MASPAGRDVVVTPITQKDETATRNAELADSYEAACDQVLLALDSFEGGNMVGARFHLDRLLRENSWSYRLRGYSDGVEVLDFAHGLRRDTWPNGVTGVVYVLVVVAGLMCPFFD